MAPEERPMMEYYIMLLPMALVGLVDAISFMVVAPSIVFYVLSLGGNYEQYGVILSAFSFASFCFKPVYGYWVDKSGYQFRAPYMVSLVGAMLGGLLYFAASAFEGETAMAIIFIGRLLGGMGAANATLGFTYVAQVIPQEQLTKLSSLLGMVRVLGMASAPAMNIFLAKVDTQIGSFKIDSLNSVGLFLFLTNLLSFVFIFLFLKEPASETKPDESPVNAQARPWAFWSEFFAPDIVLPVLGIFVVNANFQLVETGLAPAAKEILGWDPVVISTVFGINAILMLGVIAVTFQLSSMGIQDATLLEAGWFLSAAGYLSLYFAWNSSATALSFVAPFFLSVSAFPFLGAPTRSVYTKAVASYPTLKGQQGTMQAIMSMSASVAGFVAPSLLATFALRTPEEFAESEDQRAFTPVALFAPILSLLLLTSFIVLRLSSSSKEAIPEDSVQAAADEATKLVAAQGDDDDDDDDDDDHLFHPRTQAYRRNSVALMGIHEIAFEDPSDERERRSIL